MTKTLHSLSLKYKVEWEERMKIMCKWYLNIIKENDK